jgi:hypothetical protein
MNRELQIKSKHITFSILKKSKMTEERSAQKMVALKNRSDQLQIVMWHLSKVRDRQAKIDQRKENTDKNLEWMRSKRDTVENEVEGMGLLDLPED